MRSIIKTSLQRSLLVIFALTVFQPLAHSQTPAPATAPTIKARAQIVIVDVVVTDKNQNPVHNLKQSDFNVLENSTPQTISHFEEHIYPNPKAPPVEHLPPMPPGVFTNYSPEPPSDAINIILLDTLNTQMKDQSYVRAQLKQYLDTAKPGIRTAIFGLTSRLILLQGFTSNPEILKSIIDKKNPGSSPLLDDPVGTGGVEALSDQLSDILGNDPTSAQVIANMQQFEAESQAFQLQLRVDYTLDAMNLLARYLSGLPGRKNLIWFSGSFPLNVFPDTDLQQPFSIVANYDDQLRETSRLLTAAQVAVYPVDARGLFSNPSMSASNSGAKFARGGPSAMIKDQTKFSQQTFAENSTMKEMAEQTGGRAFINTNGLSQAVASAIDSGTNFYTLTYSPTDSASDSKFRKIQVKLQQQGYNLSYRRGYYAIDPNATASAKVNAPAQSPTPAPAKGAPAPPPPLDSMRAAMARGGPDPTQIIFKARILPATATSEDTLAPGSEANPSSKLSHGPYRRYQIDIAADPRPILFTKTSDGIYHSRLELRVYVYDQDGTLIIDSLAASRSDITPELLKQILAGGYPLHQQISVPAKGNYFLRIGLRDITGDRIGAIEVPVASISNLPPLSAPATPAPAPR
jgi:VWFA-related protein